MSLTSIFNCLAINRAGNNNLEAAAKTTLDSFLFRSKEPIKRRSESTKLIASLNFWPRKSCNFVASVRCFRSLSRFRGNQPHLISKSNPAVFLNAWMQKTIQISSLAPAPVKPWPISSSRNGPFKTDQKRLEYESKIKIRVSWQKQWQNNGRSSSEEQVCPVIAPTSPLCCCCPPSPFCCCCPPSPLCQNCSHHKMCHSVLATTVVLLSCIALHRKALHCIALHCKAL